MIHLHFSIYSHSHYYIISVQYLCRMSYKHFRVINGLALSYRHNRLEGCCFLRPFECEMTPDWPSSCYCSSSSSWLCISICVWDIVGKIWVVLPASCPTYLRLVCLFFVFVPFLFFFLNITFFSFNWFMAFICSFI